MPVYSKRSIKRLSTCHEDLQRVFCRVILTFDHTITEGHRGKEKQNEYFKAGKSWKAWPYGKHNALPSDGVDAAPWIDGKVSWDRRHCLHFAGFVLGVADEMRKRGEIKSRIRWGGDWDMDNEAMTDQQLQDLVHFERIPFSKEESDGNTTIEKEKAV